MASSIMSDRRSPKPRPPGRGDESARPSGPENVEVKIDEPGGLSTKGRWPVPWAFALILAVLILAHATSAVHVPWFGWAGILVAALWLDLIDVRIGRRRR
jgi:hypothetical protein